MKTKNIFLFPAALLPVVAGCAMHSMLAAEDAQPEIGEGIGELVLPSGDAVTYSMLASGRMALTLERSQHSEERPAVFVTEEDEGGFWLIPASLQGYVNTGRLDRGFFNVSALAGMDPLPVVVVYGGDVAGPEIEKVARALPGSRFLRAEPKAGVAAIEVDAELVAEFWQAVLPDSLDGSFKGSIERVLLNGNVELAPEALALPEDTIIDCQAQGLHELTVEGIRRNGQPAAGSSSLSSFQVLNVDDATIFSSSEFFTGGVGQICVPTGLYSVLGLVNTYDPDLENLGIFIPLEWVMVGNPEFEVSADIAIVLDAREANEITFGTQQQTERVDNFFRLQWRREATQGGGRSGGISGVVNLDNHPAQVLRRFAAETAPVSVGELEMLTDARLVAAGAGPASPVLYDLIVARLGHIPADLHYQADPEELAAVVNRLHGDLRPAHTLKEIRNAWRPWQTTSVNAGRDVQTTLERTEYLVAGDTRYQQLIDAAGQQAIAGPGRMNEPETMYETGERRSQTWFKPPLRPGVREFDPGAAPVVREDDTLILLMPEWVDAHPGHFGFRHPSVDTTAFRLLRDDELIASVPRPRGEFPMVPESAEYRMELDVERDAFWQSTSTRSRTIWTFHSEQGDPGETQILPVLLLDYDIELDLGNNTTANTSHLDITARHQAGAGGFPVAGIHLWISRDDGMTWEARDGEVLENDRRRFPLEDVHVIGGFVSLRVESEDEAGNGIRQEIIRAYAVPESIPPPPCPPFCPE